MIISNYKYFRNFGISTIQNIIEHSAKGSTWENHKYIKRINGTYYYPDSYEGGRHLPDSEKETREETQDENSESSKIDLSENDIEKLANEVIRGNFGNGQVRKDLLGENYSEIQKRVNEILLGSSGSKKVSEASSSSIKKAEEIAKKVSAATNKDSKVHSGVDMDKVLSVYRNKNDK